MAMMKYTPDPIDTSDVTLPKDIEALSEKIAENVHEVWALGRVSDGWIYGECRDDIKKTHPSIIPYSELSDSEKAYDLRTSRETLKLILKLGFKISR